ncbi:MAG: alpha/beta fold hydrolase [Niabella sp.]|nr:alpha/beta fold hydrolase [Niabella sp.]
MKRLLTLIIFSLPAILHGQSVAGDWRGDLNVGNGMKLPLVLHILASGDSLTTTMDSPAQGANGLPANKTSFVNNELQIELKNIHAVYKGTLAGDSISGTFTQMGNSLPLVFKKGTIKAAIRPQTPKPPFGYAIEEVRFKNPTENNELAGTLTTPHDKKQFPVVVLITGSGAQDRDETLFEHKPFWVIADYFAKNGIGVLRLDDRGMGGSSKGKDNATSADFATDISAAVNYLAQRGYRNIGLAGHSEGGMIAPIVAAQNKNVQFIISMAGPGIAIDQLMVLQSEALLRSGGMTAEKVQENGKDAAALYQFVNQYSGNNFDADLRNYLTEHANRATASAKQEIDLQVKLLSSPWFRYFLKFDPTTFITQLKIPVLAINGGKDVQVTPKENLAGWKASLQKAGNKNFEIKELPGLNHLFQEAKTGSPSEYAAIEQTIQPQVLELMAGWILKNNSSRNK